MLIYIDVYSWIACLKLGANLFSGYRYFSTMADVLQLLHSAYNLAVTYGFAINLKHCLLWWHWADVPGDEFSSSSLSSNKSQKEEVEKVKQEDCWCACFYLFNIKFEWEDDWCSCWGSSDCSLQPCNCGPSVIAIDVVTLDCPSAVELTDSLPPLDCKDPSPIPDEDSGNIPVSCSPSCPLDQRKSMREHRSPQRFREIITELDGVYASISPSPDLWDQWDNPPPLAPESE